MNLWCFVFGTCSLRYHNLRKNMGQTSHPHPLSQIGVHGSSKDQKEEWAACTWTVKKPKLSVDLKDVDVSWRTVDGRNPANQLRLVVYPIIYRVLYIPGGGLGFLNHQQHIFHQKTFDWFGCKIEGLTFDTCPEAIDQMFSQEPDPCTVSTPPKQNIWKSNRCLLKTTPFVNFLSTFLGFFFSKAHELHETVGISFFFRPWLIWGKSMKPETQKCRCLGVFSSVVSKNFPGRISFVILVF